MWPTQFGFRLGACVTDALIMARRFIDKAHVIKIVKLILFAFDWAEAFDSIMPRPMLAARERFGLPADFLAMINAIYNSLTFFVRHYSKFVN